MKPFLTGHKPAGRIFPSAGIRAVLASAGLLGGMTPGAVAADETPAFQRPAFVHTVPGEVRPARVHEIQSTEVTDLVMIAAGHREGYRPGMVCRVTRDGVPVAEILMVEVRERVSAAIIVGIFSENIIEPGDAVRVKTVQH